MIFKYPENAEEVFAYIGCIFLASLSMYSFFKLFIEKVSDSHNTKLMRELEKHTYVPSYEEMKENIENITDNYIIRLRDEYGVIDMDTAKRFIQDLEQANGEKIIIIIDALSAELPAVEIIIHALQFREEKVIAYIPHRALRGATLIAFACNEIVMAKNAVLSPFNPIYHGLPIDSIQTMYTNGELNNFGKEKLALIRTRLNNIFEVLSGHMESTKLKELRELLFSEGLHDNLFFLKECLSTFDFINVREANTKEGSSDKLIFDFDKCKFYCVK